MFKLLSVSWIEYLYLFLISMLNMLQSSVMHPWRDHIHLLFQLSPQKKSRKGGIIPLNLQATLWNQDTWLFVPRVTLTKYCFTGAVLSTSALCHIVGSFFIRKIIFSHFFIFLWGHSFGNPNKYVCFKNSVFSYHFDKLSYWTKSKMFYNFLINSLPYLGREIRTQGVKTTSL